jgi:hypothetical protein
MHDGFESPWGGIISLGVSVSFITKRHARRQVQYHQHTDWSTESSQSTVISEIRRT